MDRRGSRSVHQMAEMGERAICEFYRLIPDAPMPRRADRSADGCLPMAAYRYCEPVATASAFGWYLYPPLNFCLVWDGTEIAWTYEGAEGWEALRAAQFPGFVRTFEEIAPEGLTDLAPTFLAQGKLPGTVQIWSGYVAKTAPGWALLSRGTANIPKTEAYENLEGIIETDTWFGPLFTNVRLLRSHSPIEFNVKRPMFQVQPLYRPSYSDPPFAVREAADLTAEDWRHFAATMRPNTDMKRAPGHYAVDTRKRLRDRVRN